jgi:alkanesulfonate monooxygenase SsuD/methylene tetrahydromethanopterin reductase-like flavin-dependent oxidoreductase (luciferase family)
MGYEDVADRIQGLYLEGRKDEAAALVPDELIAETSIIGDAAEVREQVARWEEAGVTMLVLTLRSPDEVRRVAEVVLG